MKSRIHVWLVSSVLLISSVVLSSSKHNASAQNPLYPVYDYKIYYDEPTPAIIDEMGNYDLVIIEPIYYSQRQITEIQKGGTLVYGYINTMEADKWNTDLFGKLNEEDFFHRDGERIYYSEWDSYLTDITSPHYQKVLRTEVTKQIVDKGLDGAFLDTVGDIDNEHQGNPDVLYKQREGMVTWMESVREEHPDLSMIQNWGFDTLATATYPYVDGIMWESFHFSSIAYDEWTYDQIYKLRKLRENHGIQVLTVSMEEENKSKKLSRANRFKHFHTDKSYNDW
ncbi:putative glycoside hydrolase [Halobacillus salinus]|uniref:Glycosyl hydrolase n=1 Tax=Halobacillus salinus TaxID=192814 RepID=A0A4Z0H336_9BACI|nr:endo alpha-1,4 polygalactosaminidase [Halobacillus salinus]TGB03816.1 glycosyl hydrolase [Halobacillus salinus]